MGGEVSVLPEAVAACVGMEVVCLVVRAQERKFRHLTVRHEVKVRFLLLILLRHQLYLADSRRASLSILAFTIRCAASAHRARSSSAIRCASTIARLSSSCEPCVASTCKRRSHVAWPTLASVRNMIRSLVASSSTVVRLSLRAALLRSSTVGTGRSFICTPFYLRFVL